MNVAIIKYNAGNIYSVVNAVKRLGITPEVTDSAEDIMKADRVLFPGQGEAKSTMAYLRDHHLDDLIRNLKQPVLGICIGQQLMCRHSEEGNVDCLGIFDTDVKKFQPSRHEDKVPHMGWNTLENLSGPLFQDLNEKDFVYFVHSYYVPVTPYTTATTNYIVPFSASLQKDNFFATQFHPEKSGSIGERILQNFIDLKL
ncbi:MAG TPA: imidazole glycerol phosphate synthase subunit HisH [Candidatus Paraprevotella stercorigallinarum]|jgi:glutamine amidotransferase|nr:imidazole glycerol phosphate synthase subunit HisH [Candidatus Paraprevotella stercorigallinarum]